MLQMLDEADLVGSQTTGDIRQSALAEELHALRRVLYDKLRQGSLSAAQADALRAILVAARTAVEGV